MKITLNLEDQKKAQWAIQEIRYRLRMLRFFMSQDNHKYHDPELAEQSLETAMRAFEQLSLIVKASQAQPDLTKTMIIELKKSA